MQFDPGTRRDYGIGIDWLGRVVEKIDGRWIDRFCREEIFDPLDMPNTCFEVEPHLAARLASVSIHGEDGRFADFESAPPANPDFYGISHARYSTAPDFMCFLCMVLNQGALDGRRILSEAGITAMLCHQIGDVPVGRLKSAVPALSADVEIFAGRRESHSMAFMRFEEGTAGMRSAGSQGRAGVLNSHCWFDPKADAIGLSMIQSLHFAQPRFMSTYEKFEQTTYRHLQAR